MAENTNALPTQDELCAEYEYALYYRAFPIDDGGELEPEELGDSDLPF